MHLTRLPLFLDSLCVADSFSPDRFDLQSFQAPYGLDLVARSVLLSSTARDVGALAPPALHRVETDASALTFIEWDELVLPQRFLVFFQMNV